MVLSGDQGKQVWLLELAGPRQGQPETTPGPRLTPEQKADYIVRAYNSQGQVVAVDRPMFVLSIADPAWTQTSSSTGGASPTGRHDAPPTTRS